MLIMHIISYKGTYVLLFGLVFRRIDVFLNNDLKYNIYRCIKHFYFDYCVIW